MLALSSYAAWPVKGWPYVIAGKYPWGALDGAYPAGTSYVWTMVFQNYSMKL